MKENKNMETIKDITANAVTVGGVTAMLLIAGLPVIPSAAILGGTIAGCVYLTKNNRK